MTTSSATEIDSHPQCDNGEWVEQTLCEAFDELKSKVTFKKKLHASEEHNRDSHLSEFSESKIYDAINQYHSFCRLCEQHFYSRSVAGDINSFFQKHLNTSYHRQMRTVVVPPDKEPIFTWENEFRKGRCNVCDISGLEAYILDTKFETLKLMKQHICVWDKDNRETNEKVLRKLTLLKQYCGLTIFRKKLIKTINGKEVCLLCGVILPWSKENAICHLSSDKHYQKFCLFLKKCFNFAPKDVLNGFNLEVVTRSLIARDPPPITNFSECLDDKVCLEDSNCNKNPYPEDKDNFSFNPKDVELYIESKLVQNDKCMLCDVPFTQDHLSSELHRTKLQNAGKQTFVNEAKYATYCKNREKLMRISAILENLTHGKEEPNTPSPKKAKEAMPKPSFQANYLKKLLKEKFQLVSFIFTVTSDTEVFCQVCDEHVPIHREIGHLNSPNHKFHEERWAELRTKLESEKFFEPFVKLKNLILCLVCGAVMMPTSFYSHLKGDTHKRKFEWYSSLNVGIPISSAFVFDKDFSSTCTVCNWPLNRKTTFRTLKATLKNIRYHWPCPKLKDKAGGLQNEPDVSGETNNVQNEPGEDPKDSENDGLDFEKVEKTVNSLVKVFEQEIARNVLDKLDSVKLNSGKDSRKVLNILATDVRLSVEKEPSSSECSCPAEPSRENEKENKSEKTVQNESKGQKTENNSAKQEQAGKEETDIQEEEHEVLLITGLPKSKRTNDIIYSKFNNYGKIRYVFFEGKHTILAFVQPGVAEVVAKTPVQLINNYKVQLEVSTRKARAKVDKPPALHKNLIHLLQEPQKLMDFVLNLIVQAVAASESAAEKKREELVCNTIIAAILEYFPQGRCYPFGSRLSGLTLDNSDLDVFLDCGGMYEGFKNTTPAAERRLVNRVAGLLKKKWEITDIIVVDRARVPIVSFLHKPTLMHCDLSFKNGLSIQNTLLIKFMMSIDWRVKPLILFLKHWAKLNDLHGPPNFSSYAIAMLVIFYLEQLECPILPTIESLQKNYLGPRRTIAGWDCSINTNISEVKKTENKDPLPELLAGFFKYYASFNYSLNVISPLTGKLLPRRAFSDSGMSELPMCYKKQILNIPPPLENLVNDKIHICIIDPFDLSHVLTKSFTPRSVQIFTQLCRLSEDCLKKGMNVVTSPPQKLN